MTKRHTEKDTYMVVTYTDDDKVSVKVFNDSNLNYTNVTKFAEATHDNNPNVLTTSIAVMENGSPREFVRYVKEVI